MRFLTSLAITASIASAVVYRDDKPVNDYRVSASTWPAVFAWPKSMTAGMHCMASVIGTRFAITAAHCLVDGAPTVPFVVEIDGADYNVVEYRGNECWSDDGPNSADMAILVFDSDVSVTPYDVYRAETNGNEVGKEFTLMGYGDYGAIESGSYTYTGGVFHRGKNVFTKINYNMLEYKMDDNGLDLEAMMWSGDSGGPALIEVSGTDKIAGVNSNGECCSYGDTDEFCRLGSEAAYSWIVANTADSTVGNGVAIEDCDMWNGAGHLMMGSAVIAFLTNLLF